MSVLLMIGDVATHSNDAYATPAGSADQVSRASSAAISGRVSARQITTSSRSTSNECLCCPSSSLTTLTTEMPLGSSLTVIASRTIMITTVRTARSPHVGS